MKKSLVLLAILPILFGCNTVDSTTLSNQITTTTSTTTSQKTTSTTTSQTTTSSTTNTTTTTTSETVDELDNQVLYLESFKDLIGETFDESDVIGFSYVGDYVDTYPLEIEYLQKGEVTLYKNDILNNEYEVSFSDGDADKEIIQIRKSGNLLYVIQGLFNGTNYDTAACESYIPTAQTMDLYYSVGFFDSFKLNVIDSVVSYVNTYKDTYNVSLEYNFEDVDLSSDGDKYLYIKLSIINSGSVLFSFEREDNITIENKKVTYSDSTYLISQQDGVNQQYRNNENTYKFGELEEYTGQLLSTTVN